MPGTSPQRDTTAAPFALAPSMIVWLVAALAALGVLCHKGLNNLIGIWFESEEFNYGPILPVICGFLIWQQKDRLQRLEFTGSWAGVALFTAAGSMALLGELATVPVLVHYGLVFAFAGLMLATTGWPAFRIVLPAIAILLLAIPLPAFFINTLSNELQLLSSQLGVAVIRLFGISVFLEGNVIDLGTYKLQVAEACSGLRYLFPLMTLAFVMAYFFKVSWWKRALLFLSSIPLTIFMNSFRIGVIGVLVEYWGVSMAEGFLHDFEGWVVFMACTGLMFAEMVFLARLGAERRPWQQVFGVELPARSSSDVPARARRVPATLVVCSVILGTAALVTWQLPERTEIVPQRAAFVTFPMELGSWRGSREPIDAEVLDALQLSDYLMTNWVSGKQRINLYVSWYDSQRTGHSAHSPRSCLPGGGWKITSLTQPEIVTARVASQPLRVNRAVIEQGASKQLVYYWFQQRGRVITNEYLVKWYLFYDALVLDRTDGAMIRLVTSLAPDESLADADGRLSEFAATVTPQLERYVPR